MLSQIIEPYAKRTKFNFRDVVNRSKYENVATYISDLDPHKAQNVRACHNYLHGLCLLSFPALFCLIYAFCFSLFASVLFYYTFLVQLSFSLYS